MHWFLAVIGAIFAIILNENVFLWGVFGYLTGVMLTTAGRISRLEKQLNQIHEELASLKKPLSSGLNEPESTVPSTPARESISDHKQESPVTFNTVETQV